MGLKHFCSFSKFPFFCYLKFLRLLAFFSSFIAVIAVIAIAIISKLVRLNLVKENEAWKQIRVKSLKNPTIKKLLSWINIFKKHIHAHFHINGLYICMQVGVCVCTAVSIHRSYWALLHLFFFLKKGKLLLNHAQLFLWCNICHVIRTFTHKCN